MDIPLPMTMIKCPKYTEWSIQTSLIPGTLATIWSLLKIRIIHAFSLHTSASKYELKMYHNLQ